MHLTIPKTRQHKALEKRKARKAPRIETDQETLSQQILGENESSTDDTPCSDVIHSDEPIAESVEETSARNASESLSEIIEETIAETMIESKDHPVNEETVLETIAESSIETPEAASEFVATTADEPAVQFCTATTTETADIPAVENNESTEDSPAQQSNAAEIIPEPQEIIPEQQNIETKSQDIKTKSREKSVHHTNKHAPLNGRKEKEVSARLTNLSLRHAGSRPEWFDFEPLQLPGRTRQCKQIFWQIMADHSCHQKRLMALVAEPGMGKTSFLAELHTLLEKAPQTILTLAPNAQGNQPFRALRNILEQRFYISGEAPYECIESFVRGAVSSIVPENEAKFVSDGLLQLWQNRKKQNKSSDESGVNASVVKVPVNPVPEIKTRSVPKPPPLATRITSMEEILKAHNLQTANASDNNQNHANDTEDINEQTMLLTDENQEQPILEPTIILPHSSVFETALNSHHGRDQISDLGFAYDFEQLKSTLVRFFEFDLRQNSLIIILDDVQQFDSASLNMLGHIFATISEVTRLTIFLTTENQSSIPAEFAQCPIDLIELSALSDRDLAQLTHHILQKMSETREKMIVPKDLCNLIAQRSYGNPKMAIDVTMKHFNPDCMIHWNEAIEKLRREPISQRLCINLARRFRDCPDTQKLILQLISPLSAPFTMSTVECILTTWPDFKTDKNFSCSKLLKELRDEGFLEHAEDSFGPNSPTYTFKHECERLMIFGTVNEQMQRHVYSAAAQWYSLNNTSGEFDEVIGDLWKNYKFMHEACRYYEKASYRALNRAHLTKAWPLFRKLLKSLPEGNISAKIQLSLDGALVAFRTGQVDEAFRLCRRASHHAVKISAYPQAARACIQMAAMLIEMGCIRHVHRYITRAKILLNRECNPEITCELYAALALKDIFVSKYQTARDYLQLARDQFAQGQIRPRTKLYLDWLDAEIEIHAGSPQKALDMLNEIIRTTTHLEDNRIKAMAYRSLGHLYDIEDNLSGALEAWNIALGIVQEMNDTILHAQLLADIADGALQLDARKTARAATEQCLGLAQQTHQKDLISRCLANTASLLFLNGQYDKSIRILRKAHRSATLLNRTLIWTKTLLTYSLICASPESSMYDLEKSKLIYQSILHVYTARGMNLTKAQQLVRYALFQVKLQDLTGACNSLRLARAIYIRAGLDKTGEKLQAQIDSILKERKA